MADLPITETTVRRVGGFVARVGLDAGDKLGPALTGIQQVATALNLTVPENKKVVAEVVVRLKCVEQLPPNLPAFRQT